MSFFLFLHDISILVLILTDKSYPLDEDDNPFKYVNGGDGPTRYTIVNFQRASDGNYAWQKVGDYSSKL